MNNHPMQKTYSVTSSIRNIVPVNTTLEDVSFTHFLNSRLIYSLNLPAAMKSSMSSRPSGNKVAAPNSNPNTKSQKVGEAEGNVDITRTTPTATNMGRNKSKAIPTTKPRRGKEVEIPFRAQLSAKHPSLASVTAIAVSNKTATRMMKPLAKLNANVGRSPTPTPTPKWRP